MELVLNSFVLSSVPRAAAAHGTYRIYLFLPCVRKVERAGVNASFYIKGSSELIFEVPLADSLTISDFYRVTTSSLIQVHRRFGSL
jgi:hypothetical protein